MAKNTQLIEVKTTGATKSKKQIQGVSNGLKSMAKSAAMAAGAYFGARALLGAVKSSIDLFAKQELAEKKLEAALGKTSQALLNQAKAIQETTMFGDEQVIEAQALIGSFVQEEEAIMAATKATLDLAAAKGMELTVAADLVSKTLGSSTNALSRYGIEVTGAVGSTERLESLTGNLANVFGGQATEQAQTLTGQMEQMKNALGDAGETIGEILVPFVTDLSKKLKTGAERVQTFIRGFTEEPLDRTIREMKALGMNTIELEIAQNKLNQAKIEGNVIDTNAKLEAEGFVDTQQFLNEIIDQRTSILRLMEKAHLDGNNAKIEEYELLLATNDEQLKVAKQFISNQAELNLLKEEEKELNKSNFNILESYSDKTDEILDKEKDASKIRAKILKDGEKAQDRLMSKLESSSEGKQIADVKDAMRSAAKAAVKAYEWASGWGGPIAGSIAAAIAFTAASALATKVQEFATGGDFVTNGRQLIMVGDNPSGRERVQVTPLGGDPNINGPQGGGVTLNFNNPIMTDDLVESEIIPRIREGIRLGENVGV